MNNDNNEPEFDLVFFGIFIAMMFIAIFVVTFIKRSMWMTTVDTVGILLLVLNIGLIMLEAITGDDIVD